jgi:hypothetical protein
MVSDSVQVRRGLSKLHSFYVANNQLTGPVPTAPASLTCATLCPTHWTQHRRSPLNPRGIRRRDSRRGGLNPYPNNNCDDTFTNDFGIVSTRIQWWQASQLSKVDCLRPHEFSEPCAQSSSCVDRQIASRSPVAATGLPTAARNSYITPQIRWRRFHWGYTPLALTRRVNSMRCTDRQALRRALATTGTDRWAG